MSVEEIMRYVRQTPGNTNPSVVGSMVNAEMNSTLKAAKEYTDSQRLGYTETKTITWDGNTEGKHTVTVDGLNFFKMSDEPFIKDKCVAKRAMLTTADGSMAIESETFEFENLTADYGTITLIYMVYDGNSEYCALTVPKTIVDGDGHEWQKGTYFLHNEDSYAKLLELETVHQIDQKFIPGVTLPVINYEDYFKIGFFSAITKGAMTGVGDLCVIEDSVKPELFELIAKENPMVIIKIPAKTDKLSGIVYTIADAIFSDENAMEIHFHGSTSAGFASTIDYDIYAYPNGKIVAGCTQRPITSITET